MFCPIEPHDGSRLVSLVVVITPQSQECSSSTKTRTVSELHCAPLMGIFLIEYDDNHFYFYNCSSNSSKCFIQYPQTIESVFGYMFLTFRQPEVCVRVNSAQVKHV